MAGEDPYTMKAALRSPTRELCRIRNPIQLKQERLADYISARAANRLSSPDTEINECSRYNNSFQIIIESELELVDGFMVEKRPLA